MLFSEQLFPCPAVSAQLLAEIDGFLAAGRCDPGVGGVLADSRDIVERALCSRAPRG